MSQKGFWVRSGSTENLLGVMIQRITLAVMRGCGDVAWRAERKVGRAEESDRR